MTNLSPAAQAVLDAYVDEDRAGRLAVAAALRAAADQVVPETPLISYPDDHERGEWETNQQTRISLLAIAAELNNTSPPSQ
jgi:hypothetical protein